MVGGGFGSEHSDIGDEGSGQARANAGNACLLRFARRFAWEPSRWFTCCFARSWALLLPPFATAEVSFVEPRRVRIGRIKLIVYVIVAAITSMIGALIFVTKLRITPDAAFSVNDWTVFAIFIVVIGGIGSIEGPIVGTLLYFILREFLSGLGAVYLMLLGGIAILIMLMAPKGIWGLVQSALRPVPLSDRLQGEGCIVESSRERIRNEIALPKSVLISNRRRHDAPWLANTTSSGLRLIDSSSSGGLGNAETAKEIFIKRAQSTWRVHSRTNRYESDPKG